MTFILHPVHSCINSWLTIATQLMCAEWMEGSLISVQSLSRVRLFATPWTAARQSSLSITNSRSLLKLTCPSSWWCQLDPTSLSSVFPFSSYLQSFPASGSFQIGQLFASSGQNIGVSASASVLPVNTQDWFPLGWTGWISMQSKGLSRVFSNTTVQKHQFIRAQRSSGLYLTLDPRGLWPTPPWLFTHFSDARGWEKVVPDGGCPVSKALRGPSALCSVPIPGLCLGSQTHHSSDCG